MSEDCQRGRFLSPIPQLFQKYIDRLLLYILQAPCSNRTLPSVALLQREEGQGKGGIAMRMRRDRCATPGIGCTFFQRSAKGGKALNSLKKIRGHERK